MSCPGLLRESSQTPNGRAVVVHPHLAQRTVVVSHSTLLGMRKHGPATALTLLICFATFPWCPQQCKQPSRETVDPAPSSNVRVRSFVPYDLAGAWRTCLSSLGLPWAGLRCTHTVSHLLSIPSQCLSSLHAKSCSILFFTELADWPRVRRWVPCQE